MIDGVIVKPLARIADERGCVMKFLSVDDEEFVEFGEVYFSTVHPGVVKGWHLHDTNTLSYAVVSGMIKLVLFDDREDSPTRGHLQEVFMGEEDYLLVRIPPGVWNGFKGIGTKTAIVCDLMTVPHPKDTVRRLDPHDNDVIDYDWARKDR